MTIRDLYPDIKPSLNLDFANTKSLDPRVDFDRSSTATYYDGQTFAKAEENLYQYSESLNNPAGWTTFRAFITTDATTAPDGTVSADALVTASGETVRSIIRDTTGTSNNGTTSSTSNIGAIYTLSVFAKKGTNRDYLFIEDDASNINVRSWFDLNTGTLGVISSNHDAFITDVGDGWYRCGVTLTKNQAGNLYFGNAESDGSTTVTDDGGFIYLWGAQLEERSQVTAYTPTTDQPITNYIPVLQTASSDEPRFDHDPLTGESKGLLIEEQRTNLIEYSEDFTNSSWEKANLSVTANAIVAPDGTVTSDKLIDTTSGASHYIQDSVPPSEGTFTFSVFAKSAEFSEFDLRPIHVNSDQGTLTDVIFFLSGDGSFTTPPSYASASIKNVGNGWYRCAVTITITGTIDTLAHRIQLTKSGDITYTGDGYSGIYIWGAQLEES